MGFNVRAALRLQAQGDLALEAQGDRAAQPGFGWPSYTKLVG